MSLAAKTWKLMISKNGTQLGMEYNLQTMKTKTKSKLLQKVKENKIQRNVRLRCYVLELHEMSLGKRILGHEKASFAVNLPQNLFSDPTFFREYAAF